MSIPQPSPRPPPPGDEDLQHLYDEVWRIFDEESLSPTERSPFSAVSPTSRDQYPNSFRTAADPSSPSVPSARSPPPRPPPPPAHAPETRTNIEPALSPTTQRRLRPLPLPPGAVLSPVSGPADPHASPPEATPTVAVANTSRPGTANVDGRRQLPQAPSAQPGSYHNSRPSTGSATSPISPGRPVINSPQSEISPNLYKPVPAVPAVPSQANGNSPVADGYRVKSSEGSQDMRDYMSHTPSARPPGALAPTIPGYHKLFDETSLVDMYAIDESQRSRPGHHQQPSGQLRPADVYSQHHAHLHPNDGMNGTPVPPRVNDLRHQHSSSSDFIPQYPQETDVTLGRATSTGSTTSSAQTDSLGRNLSATTATTMYSDYDASTSKVGSSTLIRDNSVGSYGFSSAGPSTVQYSDTYNDSANGY
ncbi:hypothetical protein PAXINDRAFT_6862, partial [Paxillus involutus ATCC 200175]